MQDVRRRFARKTVAVTGGGGYIGAALLEALRDTPASILRVSRRALPDAPGTESFQADVRSMECWREIVRRADIVFHLAGNTSVSAAATDPADSLNSTVLPLTRLMAAAREAGRAPRVLYASTATVYGLTDVLPVAESAITAPVTTYDLHKLFAERQLTLASTQGVVEGVSLRLSNVYGPSPAYSSSEDRGILNKIATLASRGEDLRLYGDGNYLRDYVYIDDVVRAFMISAVSDNVIGRSFNVASGCGVTVRDAFNLVARTAEGVTGKTVRVRDVPWPADADPIDLRNFVADIASFSQSSGWRPSTSLAEGVNLMVSRFSGEVPA